MKPLALLEAAAKGNGSVNTDIDSSVIRRVPMLFRVAGQEGLFPALSIEALRVAQGASTYLIKSSGASSELSFGAKTGIVAIKTGEIEARTDARGRLALYDSGHRDERFVSARAVLKDEVAPDKLDGHVVFVGTSAIGLKDIRSTPVDDAAPGVEVHAQLAEQMIEHEFLARPDFADGAEFLYLAVIGALFIFLLPRLSAGRMTIVAAVFIGIGLIVPWLAFSEYDLLFDPVYPPVTLAVIYISGTALAFMRTERERSAIRGAFGLYLSPDQVERIARHPELLQLGGEHARDHRDVHRRSRLHAHIGAVRSARPDPVHEPLPHADDRPDPQSPRHDRQVHGRCDHGVLECAARCRPPCRARLRYGARHAGAPDRAQRGMEGRGRSRGPPAHSGEHRHRPQHRAGVGRQFRLRCSASPIPAWATT